MPQSTDRVVYRDGGQVGTETEIHRDSDVWTTTQLWFPPSTSRYLERRTVKKLRESVSTVFMKTSCFMERGNSD